MKSNLIFDNDYYDKGILNLCGIDEAGRGPLAGPVVAAALILPAGCEIPGLNDSKKLSAIQREKLDLVIKEKAVSYAVAVADVDEIDSLNIRQATFLAMNRAVMRLNSEPDYLLVDGVDFPSFKHKKSDHLIVGIAVVKGDGKSLSIAGASVLAKVYRDKLMKAYAEQYPQYGFEKHKGYGTEMHRQKIMEHGACPIHRRLFIRKIRAQKNITASLFEELT